MSKNKVANITDDEKHSMIPRVRVSTIVDLLLIDEIERNEAIELIMELWIIQNNEMINRINHANEIINQIDRAIKERRIRQNQ